MIGGEISRIVGKVVVEEEGKNGSFKEQRVGDSVTNPPQLYL